MTELCFGERRTSISNKQEKRKKVFLLDRVENFGLIIVLKRLRTTAFIKMFHGVLLPLVIVKKKKAGFSVLSKGALLTPAGRLRN